MWGRRAAQSWGAAGNPDSVWQTISCESDHLPAKPGSYGGNEGDFHGNLGLAASCSRIPHRPARRTLERQRLMRKPLNSRSPRDPSYCSGREPRS